MCVRVRARWRVCVCVLVEGGLFLTYLIAVFLSMILLPCILSIHCVQALDVSSSTELPFPAVDMTDQSAAPYSFHRSRHG